MDVSKVSKVKSHNSFSLRTTVPKNICNKLELNQNDYLFWEEYDKETILLKKFKK